MHLPKKNAPIHRVLKFLNQLPIIQFFTCITISLASVLNVNLLNLNCKLFINFYHQLLPCLSFLLSINQNAICVQSVNFNAFYSFWSEKEPSGFFYIRIYDFKTVRPLITRLLLPSMVTRVPSVRTDMALAASAMTGMSCFMASTEMSGVT